MAGLSGLPYFLQYQEQAQQQAMQRQYAQIQMAQFQQAQQDRQRQQAALAAAGNALPQLLAGQQQPQLPPPPGQASQPMQQPQGMQPAPQGMQAPQGGVPLPSGPVPGQMSRPPLPAGGAGGGMPARGLPPFRPLPTSASPTQAASPASIPAPPTASPGSQQPAQGPLTLESAVKVLQDQGLSGADLMAGLSQLTPILDSQAKSQAAQLQQQFQHQLQLAQLQERYDSLRQRAEDNSANRADREQAHQDSLGIQQQMLQIRRESLNSRLQGDPNAALDKDDLSFMAQQYMAGDRTVLQNLGRGAQGSKNLVALRNEVRKQAQEQGLTGRDLAASVAEFEGVKSGERALGTRTAQAGMAVNEASQFADIAQEASKAVPRSQFVPANKALNAYQTNTGDPKIVAFGAATNSLINAYARAVSPSGTPTVSDKEHAREMLNTAQTPEQYASVVSMMKREMAAAQQSPGQVRSEFREAVTRKAPMANPPPPAGGLPNGWSVTEH
ncbi:hypothetical protein E2553_00315 [Paraburkholderia dipogonis]|uniref:Uncharacterized protein n=1 Tax=Paraburkholderia dipogonis TaxID=1211383 RepID=A0A4Y8N1N9_9BURK|nr:hypothetical protein [Paraburkholderia dipogonis]TFE43614.1 hypothetical protein E2553_00315 [Paraburkholderia dipogonis]